MADKKAVKQKITENKKAVKQKVAAAKKNVKEKISKKIAANPNAVTSNRLKLLVTIVSRPKADYFTDVLQAFEVNLQTVLMAQGTANAKTLSLLGLADTDKAVILSVIQENKVPDALSVLEEKFNTIKDGKGVAWTVPLSSVIGTLIYRFLSNNKTAVKEKQNG
ncbi:MAG: hypothetical protein K2G38_04310 [Clostridia bacterium]|nr:hypothetical protein [Clostridia bacterium]